MKGSLPSSSGVGKTLCPGCPGVGEIKVEFFPELLWKPVIAALTDGRTNLHFCLPIGEGKEATSQDARFQMHIFSENIDMMEAASMKHGWSMGQDYLANSSGALGQQTWAPGQEGGCCGPPSWDNFP